jgi:hypothetical protein
MRYLLRERQAAIWSLPVFYVLSACGAAEPDCNSADARASVIKTVSGNSNNALVDYAVNTSSALKTQLDAASTEADKSAILEKVRRSAVYRLSDKITTNSKDARAVTCSGTMFATVEGETVQKMLDFKVEQEPDGKLSVSVSPFQFAPSK